MPNKSDNNIITQFNKKLDNIFTQSIENDEVKEVISFEEMQELETSGKIEKSTPIARVLNNGVVYELNRDHQEWKLYKVPEKLQQDGNE